MRTLIYILFSGLFFSSCTTTETEDEPCPEYSMQVNFGQRIKFTNATNEWTNTIDYNQLSLMATDSEWNLKYSNNGTPLQDLENNVCVKKSFDADGKITNLELWLGSGLDYDEVNKTAKGYFLLKINETTYDKIIADFDTRCRNLLITKTTYNGIEYPYTGETINIQKEE